jgi:malonyl-CoA O-methyltransferase
MVPESRPNNRTRPVDRVASERARVRLEASATAPWLHGEVARRMAERLPLMRQAPERVIDWWPHPGGSSAALAAALPKARIERLRVAAAPADAMPAWWQAGRWLRGARPAALAEAEPGRYGMVWANMLLHHEAEPLTLMQRWNEALAIDGFLMFSTLGPGSLAALRDAYRTSGFGPAMAELVDMHDLGDLLLEAGFADPVMDQEIVRLTWARPEDALAELRSLGANAAPQRHAGLRTPRWQQRLLQSLAGAATTRGRIELEFEIVYGHAFKPEPRHALAPETRIGVDELRRSLQATRAHRP